MPVLNQIAVSADVDQALTLAFDRLETTDLPVAGESLRTGVDLGTASIIVSVLGADGRPLATELQPARVAQDGLVVDYLGAVDITRRLVSNLNARLGVELETAAIAMPPGTANAESNTHRHIVEAAGLRVTQVLDEPSAAGTLLGIQSGAVVDIGGGTTGLSVFRDGQVVYTADEPTGGTHVSLVLMGRHRFDFEQAEAMKADPAKRADVKASVLPVMQKMASIVERHLRGADVDRVYLVGGTSSLLDIDAVFAQALGLAVVIPPHPMLVTPIGIALNDKE